MGVSCEPMAIRNAKEASRATPVAGGIAPPALTSAVTAALAVITNYLVQELTSTRVNLVAAGFVVTPLSSRRRPGCTASATLHGPRDVLNRLAGSTHSGT